MTQNIYDNQEFFMGYSQLPRSREGLSAAPEWEAVKRLLPTLKDARVLDLGCGFGAFDRWAITQGADSILGIDLSENMLARASEMTDSDAIEYRKCDLSEFGFDESNFDLIYSALTFHYIPDFHSLCRRMRTKLVKGGRLVATVEHPIFTAPSSNEWMVTDSDSIVWPLDLYFDEGRRARSWFTEGVIKYHRTIESYLMALLENSFSILQINEWKPSSEQIAEYPQWARERDRPMFLLFSAEAV